MSKLLYSAQIQLNEFRAQFHTQASAADLGTQLMYVIGDYKKANDTLAEAKRFIADNDMPLVAIGSSLGFHYHAIYIRPLIINQ